MINKENLAAFLKPKSIAIIGVSADLTKISGKPLKYLLDFKYPGNIFPVNPKYQKVAGISCYPNLNDISDEVDLALICLPAEKVLHSLIECVKKKIKSAIVFGSGFAETGKDGKIRQEELANFANNNNILICGPNCQGMINFHEIITASFSGALDRGLLLRGNIAFISHSGAYGGAILNMAQESGIGFSYWISTGNECDLTSFDLMEYLIDDAKTAVIAIYMEGLKDKDIKRLKPISQKALSKKKPIVIMKVGTSEVGRKAAASHTGALTGSDSIFNAICKQTGMIRVYDLEELIDTMSALSMGYFPKGNRIGIVTTSGGAGVSIADKAFQAGLHVPELKDETKKKLLKILPPFGSTLNPVDITGQMSHRVVAEGAEGGALKKSIEIVVQDENIDILLINITMAGGKERAKKMANDLVGVFKNKNKPILLSWLAGDLAKDGYEILVKNEIKGFKTPDRCVSALKKIVEYNNITKNFQEEIKMGDY